MSAAAPRLTKKQVKELKQQFFNAIEKNDADQVKALIPRLRESRIGLNVDLQAFHPTGTFDPIQPLYPISIAIFYKAYDVLRPLIEGGADINMLEKFYIEYGDSNDNEENTYERLDKDKVFTPLRYAVYFKRDEAARILLEAGARYPDEDDYMDENNDYLNENNENNNDEDATFDYPVGYYGMIDEIISNMRNPPILVSTLEYIAQNTERLGVTHDDILEIFRRNIANVGTVRNFVTLFKILYNASDNKYDTYMAMLPFTYNLASPYEFFKFAFENGIDANTVDSHGQTVLFIYTRPLKKPDYGPHEKIEDRVAIIRWLIASGVNHYLPNSLGETPAVRAIKQGLPKPIIDALNVRSIGNIYELREINPYLVNKLATKFTKKHLRNTPKSYAALLTQALDNTNNNRNNAPIAFRPANIPNITGRSGKNYQKMKSTQRQRAAEMRGPTTGGNRRRANLNRTRRRTLKATKPL